MINVCFFKNFFEKQLFFFVFVVIAQVKSLEEKEKKAVSDLNSARAAASGDNALKEAYIQIYYYFLFFLLL